MESDSRRSEPSIGCLFARPARSLDEISSHSTSDWKSTPSSVWGPSAQVATLVFARPVCIDGERRRRQRPAAARPATCGDNQASRPVSRWRRTVRTGRHCCVVCRIRPPANSRSLSDGKVTEVNVIQMINNIAGDKSVLYPSRGRPGPEPSACVSFVHCKGEGHRW